MAWIGRVEEPLAPEDLWRGTGWILLLGLAAECLSRAVTTLTNHSEAGFQATLTVDLLEPTQWTLLINEGRMLWQDPSSFLLFLSGWFLWTVTTTVPALLVASLTITQARLRRMAEPENRVQTFKASMPLLWRSFGSVLIWFSLPVVMLWLLLFVIAQFHPKFQLLTSFAAAGLFVLLLAQTVVAGAVVAWLAAPVGEGRHWIGAYPTVWRLIGVRFLKLLLWFYLFSALTALLGLLLSVLLQGADMVWDIGYVSDSESAENGPIAQVLLMISSVIETAGYAASCIVLTAISASKLHDALVAASAKSDAESAVATP